MKIEKEKFVKKIKNADDIYIMGHIDLDLDAIGSAIGILMIIRQLGKDGHIIINDTTSELAVEQVLKKTENDISFVHGSKVSFSEKNLLIIVDTNKKYLLQDPSVLDKIPNHIIIDHHGVSEETISTGILWVEEDASSTCEMLTELMDSLNIILSSEINTFILAGIVLDTNNFVVKTDEKTYYSAYLLTKNGANPIAVQYLLKQDLQEYIDRQKVITNAIVYDHIAITKGESYIRYRREDLAKMADTLLQFKGIEASFVIGSIGYNSVGVSARSMGNYPVATILEQMGGGGDTHDAAAKIQGNKVEEVEEEILSLIRKEKSK